MFLNLSRQSGDQSINGPQLRNNFIDVIVVNPSWFAIIPPNIRADASDEYIASLLAFIYRSFSNIPKRIECDLLKTISSQVVPSSVKVG
jgi:hypothetical protein